MYPFVLIQAVCLSITKKEDEKSWGKEQWSKDFWGKKERKEKLKETDERKQFVKENGCWWAILDGMEKCGYLRE